MTTDATTNATSGPVLFRPKTIRDLTIRNRIAVSPMSQYAAVDGAPTDWHLVHLGKFAMGGAGIVFVEETTVEESARKTYHCPGIYTDAQAKAWRRITDFLRGQGALSAIQLGHAGRKVATRAPWDGFSPLTEEDAKKGEQVYGAQKCMTCHAISGKGNKNNPLDGVGTKISAAEIKEWIMNPTEMTAKIKSTKKPPMPNRYSKLPAADIDAMVAYMASLK